MEATETGKHPLWGLALPTVLDVLLEKAEEKIEDHKTLRKSGLTMGVASGFVFGGILVAYLPIRARSVHEVSILAVYILLFFMLNISSYLQLRLAQDCISDAIAYSSAIQKFVEDYEKDYGVKIT